MSIKDTIKILEVVKSKEYNASIQVKIPSIVVNKEILEWKIYMTFLKSKIKGKTKKVSKKSIEWIIERVCIKIKLYNKKNPNIKNKRPEAL